MTIHRCKIRLGGTVVSIAALAARLLISLYRAVELIITPLRQARSFLLASHMNLFSFNQKCFNSNRGVRYLEKIIEF